MIRYDRRSLASVYEDARNVGLVLIGAGILGLGGLGNAAFGAVAIVVLGLAFWLLSVLRPIKVGEEQEWKRN